MLLKDCKVLEQKEIDDIIEMALRLLDEIGCIYTCNSAIKKMSELGCNIAQDFRVQIPKMVAVDLIEEFRQLAAPGDCSEVRTVMGKAPLLLTIENSKEIEGRLEYSEKIIALAQQLDHIDIITAGVDPVDLLAGQRELGTTELLLKYSDKPFAVFCSDVEKVEKILQMATIATGSLEHLIQQPRCHGFVQPEQNFLFSTSNIELLDLYSKYGQPIHLKNSFRASPDVPAASTLSMQIAEYLAGVCYLTAAQSRSTVFMELSMPFLSAAGDGRSDIAFIMNQLALAQIIRDLGLRLAVPALPMLWGYDKSLRASLQRIAGMRAGMISRAGQVAANTFSPVHLVLENEIIGYFKNTVFHEEHYSSGPMKIAASPLVFRYDGWELWRSQKMDMESRLCRDIAHKWSNLVPKSYLNDSQSRELERFRRDGNLA